MNRFHFMIIVLLLVQLLLPNASYPVVRAENTAPTPTSEATSASTISETPTSMQSFKPTRTSADGTDKITASQKVDAGATTSELGPVIFVPGIMGSYLDYKNPNDAGNVCNIWPTSAKIQSTGRCKIVTWGGIGFINEANHRDILIQLNNPDIYATDAIRNQRHTAWLGNAYITLMDRLNSTWPEYRGDESLFAKTSIDRCNSIKEKVNRNEITRNQTLLYAFGYDWRQTTKYNAAKLSEFIDCVRSTHNNAKISLVGHSMGGLVIKQLLLNYKDNSSIANVSTFNTPYLGAVRAIQIMGDGNYDSVSYWILGAEYLQEVAKNVPGAIELLPANLYLQKYPCRLVVNGNAACNDSEYWDRISTAFGNQAKNYQLADSVGRDDAGEIVERTKGINYLIQFSPNKNTTVAQVKKNGSNWSNDMGTGDGTVNEFSLTRYIPGDVDWNPKMTSTRRVFTIGFCNHGIDHTGIVSYGPALDNLIWFLKNPAEFRKNEPNTTCSNGDTVQMNGSTYSEDANFTNVNPPDRTLSLTGRWPELSWQYPMSMDSALRSAFYIEVAKIDADWNNPAVIPDVYECVSISNFSGKYTIPIEAFMAQRQGTYKWRVRRSAVNMSNPQACKNANRGATTGWMPYRKFTSFGIEPITPMSQDKSFVTTFSARTIADSIKNYSDTLAFSPTKVQYRLEVKQGNNKIYSQCKDTPVFNMQDSPSLFANLLQYDGAVTYTFEALYTFVPNGVINCDLLVFYPSKWRSYPRTFTMATKPELLAPAPDSSTTDGRWPQLSWRPFGGVAGVVAPFGYRVQVSRSGDFSKDLLVDECTIATTYRPDNDGWMAERYGKLFWRISYATQAWTDKKQCRVALNSWSDGRSFTSQVGTVLTEPATGSTSSTGMWPTLRWTNGSVTITNTGYRIQVSTDAQFGTIVVDECTTAQSYAPNNNWWSQSRMGTFYWRVNYVRQAWTTQSQCKAQPIDNALWSETRTFVNPVVDKTVQLSTPATGFISPDGLWPQVQWSARVPSLAQHGYRIQVSTNRNFTGTLTVDECRTTTSYRPTDDNWMRDPSRNGTFFWRVNYLAQPWNGAVNTCQTVYVEPALWSEVRTFVNRPPANAVVLTTADGMQTTNGLWPQLQWSNGLFMTAANGYRIQISRDSTFRSFEVDECTSDTTYLPRDAWWSAERTGVYYWRVNYMQKPWVGTISSSCKDATKINNQLWSVPRTFENPPVNVVPQLTAPAEGAQNPNGLWYQLQWNPGNATLATYGYRIQVSKNRNFTGTLTVDECRTTKGYQSTDENWMRAPERNGEFFWRINYVRSAWNNEQDVCKRQAVSATWSEVRSFKNVQPTNPVALSLPADGYRSNNGLWPQLQWSNGAYMTTSNGYRIQISRDRTFGTTEVDQCTNDNFYVPQEAWWAAERTGVYYWRVNYMQKPWVDTMSSSCKDATKINNQLWSVPRTFENPPVNVVPQLTAPAEGAQSPNGLWYQLQWNPGNATLATYGYRIQVSKNRNFTGTLTVDECRTTNGYQSTDENWMRAPERNGEFFWRINYVRSAWNNDQDVCKRQAVSATWSEVRSFKNVQPANPVVISAPANGAVTSDGSWPRIEWTNGAYMDHMATFGYRIQISRASNFSNPIVDECTTNRFYLPGDVWWMLDNQGQFYYRVNYVRSAWNGDKIACKQQTTDSRLWSESSRVFTNSVSNIKPQLVEPSDGMTSQDGLWPTLRWQPVRSAFAQFGYRIQVSKSRSFTSTIVDECRTDTSYRPDDENWMRADNQNGDLYWRINYVPKQWNGNQDACKRIPLYQDLWSGERKFVNKQASNPVVATSPSSGFTSTNGAWPRVEWTNGAYMGHIAKFGYRIQISTSSSFSSTIVDECLNSTSYSANDFWWEQSQQGTYYWRVNYMLRSWSGAQSDSCKDDSKINRVWWSQSRSFVNPRDNRATQASSPSNGHTTSDGLWPTISWSPYSSGYAQFGYRVQMSPNSNFSALYVDECTTGTSYRPGSEAFMRDRQNRVYWRVTYMMRSWSGNTSSSCKDDSKINSALWSSSRYFNNPMPQNKVSLSSPSNGYRSSGGIWPTIKWSAGSNMSYYFPYGYYIEVSRNSSFTDRLVYQCTTGTSYKPDSNSWMQSIRTRLYWRISYIPSAWNGNQNTCKSMNFSSSLRSETRYFDNP